MPDQKTDPVAFIRAHAESHIEDGEPCLIAGEMLLRVCDESDSWQQKAWDTAKKLEEREAYLVDIWQRAWDQCVADDLVFAKIKGVLEEQPNGMTLTSAEAHWRLGEIARIVRDA